MLEGKEGGGRPYSSLLLQEKGTTAAPPLLLLFKDRKRRILDLQVENPLTHGITGGGSPFSILEENEGWVGGWVPPVPFFGGVAILHSAREQLRIPNRHFQVKANNGQATNLDLVGRYRPR